MRFNRRLPDVAAVCAAALALAAAFGPAAHASGHDLGKQPPGRFDDYVLSLSSVPGFCATSAKTPAECKTGLAFALHGLWPQLNDGDWPSNCSTVALTPADLKAAHGLYADPSLIGHEWPKHGTCSGLSPAAYFALSRQIDASVNLPPGYGAKTVIRLKDAKAVMAAFEAANPGLAAGGIRTVGTKGVLTEVDICVTKTGKFRAC